MASEMKASVRTTLNITLLAICLTNPSVAISQAYQAMTIDQVGEATAPPEADILFSNVFLSFDSGNVYFAVHFDNPLIADDSRVHLFLDADGDQDTGRFGVTECGELPIGFVGAEYWVIIEPSFSTTLAEVNRFPAGDLNRDCLEAVETFYLPVNTLPDGYEVTASIDQLSEMTSSFAYFLKAEAENGGGDFAPDIFSNIAQASPADEEASDCGGALASCQLSWSCTAEPATTIGLEVLSFGHGICKVMAEYENGGLSDAAAESIIFALDSTIPCTSASGISACWSLIHEDFAAATSLYRDDLTRLLENSPWVPRPSMFDGILNAVNFSSESNIIGVYSPVSVQAEDLDGNQISISGDGNVSVDSGFNGMGIAFSGNKKLILLPGISSAMADVQFVGEGVSEADSQYSVRLYSRGNRGQLFKAFDDVSVLENQLSLLQFSDVDRNAFLAIDSDSNGEIDTTLSGLDVRNEEFAIFQSGFEDPRIGSQ